jgi:selenide,water dikinase
VGINGPDGVHAATDVTGYGLLGHARNIAVASHVTLTFRADALPLFPGALELAGQNILTGAARGNEDLLAGQLDVAAGVGDALRRLVLDAETSGGLLIAVASESADELAAELRAQGVAEFARVGMVEPRGKALLRLL